MVSIHTSDWNADVHPFMSVAAPFEYNPPDVSGLPCSRPLWLKWEAFSNSVETRIISVSNCNFKNKMYKLAVRISD